MCYLSVCMFLLFFYPFYTILLVTGDDEGVVDTGDYNYRFKGHSTLLLNHGCYTVSDTTRLNNTYVFPIDISSFTVLLHKNNSTVTDTRFQGRSTLLLNHGCYTVSDSTFLNNTCIFLIDISSFTVRLHQKHNSTATTADNNTTLLIFILLIQQVLKIYSVKNTVYKKVYIPKSHRTKILRKKIQTIKKKKPL